jgi:competence protein ComEC
MDRHIELLILSHPDKDHVTALPELLRRYSIERMILTGVEHDLGQYQDLIEEIDTQNIEVLWPDPKMDIDMGDGLVLDILWPDSNALDPELETNDTSIVFKAIFKEHSILFTGDINDDIEQRIMSMGEDVRSDILKVAHHGSKTSSSTGFLLEVDPDLAVISVGKDNSYGHPHPLITKRFHQLGIETKTTADLGTISLEFE